MTRAKAEAEAVELRGQAEAAGSVDNDLRQINAQARLRCKGEVPQFCSATPAPAQTRRRCRSSRR